MWNICIEMYLYIELFLYNFVRIYIYCLFWDFTENLRNLEKKSWLEKNLEFFINWDNLYIDGKLLLCRLKTVKAVLPIILGGFILGGMAALLGVARSDIKSSLK